MTLQETFDTVVNALRKQNAKCGKTVDMSGREKFICLYRYEDKKCAAGHLIPDEKYYLELEGKDLIQSNTLESDITNSLTEVGKIIMDEGHDINLVVDLQNVHDYWSVKFWEVEFERLADKYHLKYGVPV